MLYRLARLLQMIGLFVLIPLAIAGNVADEQRVGLREMLGLSAAGMGVFFLGWLLQQAVKPGGQ